MGTVAGCGHRLALVTVVGGTFMHASCALLLPLPTAHSSMHQQSSEWQPVECPADPLAATRTWPAWHSLHQRTSPGKSDQLQRSSFRLTMQQHSVATYKRYLHIAAYHLHRAAGRVRLAACPPIATVRMRATTVGTRSLDLLQWQHGGRRRHHRTIPAEATVLGGLLGPRHGVEQGPFMCG